MLDMVEAHLVDHIQCSTSELVASIQSLQTTTLLFPKSAVFGSQTVIEAFSELFETSV